MAALADLSSAWPAARAESPAMSSTQAPARPAPQPRDSYRHFQTITTRWLDNDLYGHVNNIVYYSYFDTVVNAYLIEAGALDIHRGEVIGLVVQTQCDYFAELAFPRPVQAGLRVARMGTSSVRYEVGLFDGAAPLSAASGHFVHVYVDRSTRRPVPLPTALRNALHAIAVEGAVQGGEGAR
jgi:acyl-CoA thioester hydrolase